MSLPMSMVRPVFFCRHIVRSLEGPYPRLPARITIAGLSPPQAAPSESRWLGRRTSDERASADWVEVNFKLKKTLLGPR